MITIIDKNNTYIADTVKIGDNCIIYPNVFIEGNTIIGENNIIYMSSYIKDSTIGNNNNIYSSYIMDSYIGDNNKIGPYAYIRDHNQIGNDNRLGAFVELKENNIGNGNKIPHLSYIGNADVNNNVQIGCGSITVNKKVNSKIGEREKTIILDNSFIGCNVNLLAPVTIGNNSVVAAGSTITDDVPNNALAVARNRQTVKEDYH